MIDALKPEGYEANQPFLRILYNVDGYYKFWGMITIDLSQEFLFFINKFNKKHFVGFYDNYILWLIIALD